jgi:hypothetical protein
LIAQMTASKVQAKTWLTTFEITVGPCPRPSEVRRVRDLQGGPADG